jgi:hypothetical protein
VLQVVGGENQTVEVDEAGRERSADPDFMALLAASTDVV